MSGNDAQFSIGERATVINNGKERIVTIKWSGIVDKEIHKNRPFLYGIEYSEPICKHSGRGLWTSKPMHASLVPLSKLSRYPVRRPNENSCLLSQKPAKKSVQISSKIIRKKTDRGTSVPQSTLKKIPVSTKPRSEPMKIQTNLKIDKKFLSKPKGPMPAEKTIGKTTKKILTPVKNRGRSMSRNVSTPLGQHTASRAKTPLRVKNTENLEKSLANMTLSKQTKRYTMLNQKLFTPSKDGKLKYVPMQSTVPFNRNTPAKELNPLLQVPSVDDIYTPPRLKASSSFQTASHDDSNPEKENIPETVSK